MYSNVYRNNEYIVELKKILNKEYNIQADAITAAKRGYYGETWRLATANNRYFIKLVYPAAYADAYERSFPIIEHLCGHGIDFISRIIKTKDGSLSTRFDGAVLGVFEWITGGNIETDAAKIPEYQMLAKVYSVPADGLPITKEDFSTKSAEFFFEQWALVKNEKLNALLEKKRAKLEHRAARLIRFSVLCQNNMSGFVITHGDAGGNLIKDEDRYFIVDWDNPILAPPDRDAWVMCSHDWARDAFQNALCRNGIEYTLRPERLAYYCYHFFFFYLTSFLNGFTQTDTVKKIEEYIDGWIEKSFEYADQV